LKGASGAWARHTAASGPSATVRSASAGWRPRARRGLAEQRAKVVHRGSGQGVGEDDDAKAPALLARQPAQLGARPHGLLLGLDDRDANALGPEAELAEPSGERVPGGEQDVVPGLAARHGQREEREDVAVGRAAREDDPHRGR
jgi:hypothetical protein